MTDAYVFRIITGPDPDERGRWIARDRVHAAVGRGATEMDAVQSCVQAIADRLREMQREKGTANGEW